MTLAKNRYVARLKRADSQLVRQWLRQQTKALAARADLTDWRGQPLTMESEGAVIAAGDRRILDQTVATLGA